MDPATWLGLIVAAFFTGMFVGGALALRMVNRDLRRFKDHEAEIRRRNAELDERIRGGCRQRLPEGK
jgi:uncharacterized membrane-anchored protein YhcB (DUF1043 family)